MNTWLNELKHRRRFRAVQCGAHTVVADGQGVAARTWPVQPALPLPAWAMIRQEAYDWLAQNLAQLATPYGWSECSVFLALAQVTGDQRTLLWKVVLPPMSRADRAAAIVQADTALAELPLSAYPAATQIELYVLDMGTVLREAFATIDGDTPKKNGD